MRRMLNFGEAQSFSDALRVLRDIAAQSVEDGEEANEDAGKDAEETNCWFVLAAELTLAIARAESKCGHSGLIDIVP